MRIVLEVRRFVCRNVAWPQRTFAEQLPGSTSAYARCTDRLGALLNVIALALVGRAGARMTASLGITADRMGLLDRVRAMPDPSYDTPRVLGVDDFSIKRGGHTYATVLTCADTHRAVDVLPTREAGPLTAWQLAHPSVDVICRDGVGAYAEGAAAGAPSARQVADRYHLWANLGQAVEKCVAIHRAWLPARSPTTNSPPATQPPSPTTPHGNGRLAARLQAHHALVHGLFQQGMGLRATARHGAGVVTPCSDTPTLSTGTRSHPAASCVAAAWMRPKRPWTAARSWPPRTDWSAPSATCSPIRRACTCPPRSARPSRRTCPA